MYVHLRPRLNRALDMLRGSQTVADIGSDHGRLAVALLQQGAAERVIACDISAPSLEKARALCGRCGLGGRMDFRVADGLGGLHPGEADALVMAGMGGPGHGPYPPGGGGGCRRRPAHPVAAPGKPAGAQGVSVRKRLLRTG